MHTAACQYFSHDGGFNGPQISLGGHCFLAAEPEAGKNLSHLESELVTMGDTQIHYIGL